MSNPETMAVLRPAGKRNTLPGIDSLTTCTGKSERRCIMRYALGYYRAVIVAGLYVQQLQSGSSGEFSIETFIPALKYCIAAHPILSAAIHGEGTESPQFVRPATLDLRNHIKIRNPQSVSGKSTANDMDLLKQVLIETHDQLYPDIERIPPWKIVLLPISPQPGSAERRFHILFSYSHSHGDGKSGLAFHRAFITGLETGNLTYDSEPIYKSPSSPLLPPIEQACKLKISLPFLLGPFIATYMPKFLSGMFNSHASATPQTPNSWIGTLSSYDPENFHTGLEIMVIDKDIIRAVLAVCRAHGAKFTGFVHQVIVRALSQALPADTPAGNFVGQTAVDLRNLIPGISNDDMALCMSGVYEAFPRIDERSSPENKQGKNDSELMWAAARNTTERLAAGANTLTNQPIGLLQYLAHFRMWLVNQIGKPHDGSYEISNLVSFDPFSGDKTPTQQQAKSWDVERMIFSQPANPTSSPLCFQFVSRKNGDMVMTLTWQRGVLGVPDEDKFVNGINNTIQKLISSISSEAS
jgi:hypothetical protein